MDEKNLGGKLNRALEYKLPSHIHLEHLYEFGKITSYLDSLAKKKKVSSNNLVK